MPDPLQTVCCCCNVFRAAKGLNLTEFVFILLGVILTFINSSIGLGILWPLLQLVYLAVEYYGIHKADKFLILFGCIIRVLQTIIIAILIIAFFAIPICPDMLGTRNCDELRSQIGQENNSHETNFTDDQLQNYSKYLLGRSVICNETCSSMGTRTDGARGVRDLTREAEKELEADSIVIG